MQQGIGGDAQGDAVVAAAVVVEVEGDVAGTRFADVAVALLAFAASVLAVSAFAAPAFVAASVVVALHPLVAGTACDDETAALVPVALLHEAASAHVVICRLFPSTFSWAVSL